MRDPERKNRYAVSKNSETELQPEATGHVLRNIPGITSEREIDIAEFEALRSAQLHYVEHVITSDTVFTADVLCQMHAAWLGDLYKWAGRYRTVNVSKAGFSWPPYGRVPKLMHEFEKGFLAKLTPCRPGELRLVSTSIATIHGDLLLIHPFREGNGRLARWLADLMALQAGLPAPHYGFTGEHGARNSERYLAAVLKAYAMDYADLAEFFEAALERALEPSD